MAAIAAAAAAAIIGGGISTYGSYDSARKANNASSDARYANEFEVKRQRDNLGASIFGNSYRQMMDPYGNYTGESARTGLGTSYKDGYGNIQRDQNGTLSPHVNYIQPEQMAAQDQFTNMMGGPLYDQFKSLNANAAQQAGQVPGMYDAETAKLMGSANDYTNRLRSMYSSGSNAILGAYDKGAGGLMRMQDSFGQARDKTIRRDSARQLTGMNDATRATLAASGFGNSTALPNMLNANAKGVGEQQDNALTALTGQRVALGRSLHGERAGMTKDLFSQSAQALERSMGAEQALGQTRSDNSFNLKQADIANQLKYKSAPLNFAYSALTGGGLSPYGDASASLPLPSYSPTGIAASTGGNAAAGMGSMLLMQQLMGKGGGGSNFGSYGGQMDQMYNANR
jgi:hypothetical protein